jgi:hypothetical protein
MQIPGIVNHMTVGHDIPIGSNDKAGAAAFTGAARF